MKRIKNKNKKIKNNKKPVYTEGFRKEALEIYKHNDKNMKETAKELKIAYSTFAAWVKAAGLDIDLDDPNLSELERENLRLKLELADVKEERDILKKGLAILRSKSLIKKDMN